MKLRPLSEARFRNPPAACRGAPFWAWNSRLDRAALLRQIDIFQQMGFGGFQMHARTGLDTEYLGPEYAAVMRACVERAAQKKMFAWLYDEDRWPSGYAGGGVTRDPAHRMKYLLFTRQPYGGARRPTPNLSYARAGRTENGTLLARYEVRLADGRLAGHRRLPEGGRARPGTQEWFAYLESAEGTPWFNHQTYVDTLSAAALGRFVELTYEPMHRWLGKYFGGVIPAIFTDEPQHVYKECFGSPEEGIDLVIPATADFFASFQNEYGRDLLEDLPELFWERPGGAPSLARYRYHDHVTARFATAFAGTLGNWCRSHGIKLTGHMMEEPTLFSQTRATGEAMRSLAHFDLPGVDMLCDRTELNTVKQAQSIARQYGRSGVMSELYGATGWSFDFVGHKAQGDWQAALGVTIRVPHLAWASMQGEAKRDYPASIHYQSPWWRHYRLIEDHFARIQVAMTRGTAVVHVAVIHPVESYWLCYGPWAQTKAERDRRERQFADLPEWLLGALIDFDYVCEALLPSQAVEVESELLRIGQGRYRTVIVPGLRTLRATTLAVLERFAAAGGTVIFAGEIPSLLDAKISGRAARFAAKAVRCPWESAAILTALEPGREADCTANGVRVPALLHQLRADGPERHLFLCHRDRLNSTGPVLVQIKGHWRAICRDTTTGSVREIAAKHEMGWTVIPAELAPHGHLLLTLRPGRPRVRASVAAAGWVDVAELADPAPIILSEPNTLLLDRAEWRWNAGPWQGPEEILRIDNRVRQCCGLTPRDGHDAQPWAEAGGEGNQPRGTISLRFRFRSQIGVDRPQLAIERAREWQVLLDGRPVKSAPGGWWVDEAIQRLALPAFGPGDHELVLTASFARRSELEACYLLGDFGVTLAGRHAVLTAPVRTLTFGDWSGQGLPFYTGNVTYRLVLRTDGRQVAVQFPRFKSPVIEVAWGKRRRPVAFAPFRCELGKLTAGRHRLDVTVYGDRHNAFGPLHNIDPGLVRYGPSAWRSQGGNWSYEYQIRPMGLLTAPRVQRRGA